MTICSNLLNSRVVRGAWCVMAAFAVACGTKEAPGPLEPTGPTGRIRFVNLITDQTRNPVNAILENVPFGVNLGYGGSTPASLPAPNTAIYSAIYTGDRKLVLKKTADTSVTVANFTVTINQNEDRTVFATGGTGGGAVAQFSTADNNAAVAAGTTRLRFIDMSPAAGAVDVFVTAPNADLATATPVASVNLQTASAYLTTITPGTYQIRFVPAGTAPANRSTSVVANIASTALASGAARTIVLANNLSGTGTVSTTFVLTDQ